MNFAKFLRKSFLIERLWATASVKGTTYDRIIVGNNFLGIKPQKYIVKVLFNFLSELSSDLADTSDHSHQKRISNF